MLSIIDSCNLWLMKQYTLQMSLCCRLRESLQAHHAIKDHKQKQTRSSYTPIALVEASMYRFAMRRIWKYAWKVSPHSRWGYNALDKHTSTCKNTLTYYIIISGEPTSQRHHYEVPLRLSQHLSLQFTTIAPLMLMRHYLSENIYHKSGILPLLWLQRGISFWSSLLHLRMSDF